MFKCDLNFIVTVLPHSPDKPNIYEYMYITKANFKKCGTSTETPIFSQNYTAKKSMAPPPTI